MVSKVKYLYSKSSEFSNKSSHKKLTMQDRILFMTGKLRLKKTIYVTYIHRYY